MQTRGEKMRGQVLDVLRQHGVPLSAYDILGVLRDDHPKIAPPTVYRALATLTERGCVHRVESLNAYIACTGDRHAAASILSICGDCGGVEESVAPELLNEISNAAERSGFRPARHVVEVHGVCAACDKEGMGA